MNGIKRNIIIGKVGGNANENSINYKVSLPAKMVKELGITKEDRKVILTYEDDKIIIKKDILSPNTNKGTLENNWIIKDKLQDKENKIPPVANKKVDFEYDLSFLDKL